MLKRPTRHKVGHFGDVLPGQSPGVVGTEHAEPNIIQTQTTLEQNSLS